MISSTSNPRIKWVRSLGAKRRKRYEEGLFILEGNHLALEVVRSQLPVRMVLHVEGLSEIQRALLGELAELGSEVLQVSSGVMAACSSTDTPPGLLIVMPMPALRPVDSISLAIVIDHMNDPGNLGTLLRSALGAGVEIVYLSQGTVDPFNPKVVRGGAGAHLHLPIVQVETGELQKHLQGLNVWVAESSHGQFYHHVDWRGPSAIVIGSETHGTSAVMKRLSSQRVTIPHDQRVESLNAAVAGSIILFEIARQRGAG